MAVMDNAITDPVPETEQATGWLPLSLMGLPMPITLRPARPLSEKQLIAFSRENRPFQIERNAKGELEIRSPSGVVGSSRELFVGRMLGNWADAHGGTTVGATAGFKLDGVEIRCPDAAWVSDQKMQGLSREQREGFAPFRPDFLIEVRSKHDARRAAEAKMRMWIEAGAELAWLIDPFEAKVLIYRPRMEVEVLVRPDWVEAATVVPGFRLEMARLWA